MRKKSFFKGLSLSAMVGAAAAVPAISEAADVPFTVTAPTFDWTVLGTIAVSMLTVYVGMKLFRLAKGTIR